MVLTLLLNANETGPILTGYVFLKESHAKESLFKRTIVKDSLALRMEIIKSIKRPFDFGNADTLILSTAWEICGSMSEKELQNLPVSFPTAFGEKTFREKLSYKLGIPIIDFHYYVDSVLNHIQSADVFEDLEKTKVHATITADISKDDGHIYVHEDYRFGKDRVVIDKEFYLNYMNEWVYQ